MFDFEKWLSEATNCEDPDSWINMSSGEDKTGFSIFDNENRVHGEGKTLGEACLNFDINFVKTYNFSYKRTE